MTLAWGTRRRDIGSGKNMVPRIRYRRKGQGSAARYSQRPNRSGEYERPRGICAPGRAPKDAACRCVRGLRARRPAFLAGVGGFTLIELLTVIAIIGILAAILIPVVSAARHSANQAKNVVQLRNLGMACHTYAIDHDGGLPVVVRHPGRDGPRRTQSMNLWPHQSQNALSLLSDRWGESGVAWGPSDYLDEGPDAFYGPFTPHLDEGRGAGQFFSVRSGFKISYVYYSLPSVEDWDGRSLLAPGLHNDYNDRGEYLGSTPLFSDITADAWAERTGFNGKSLSVVRLDGSVQTFDREFLGRVGSADTIRVLAGLLDP